LPGKPFKILTASAGSGKTFNLIKEFLFLVMKNPDDYKHILAITFTNKATEEMKTRIIESLMDLARGNKKNDFYTLIDKEYNYIDIPAQATKVLENILHHYSNFHIQTIDAFFQKVVRAFAKELELQIGYELELDTDLVLSIATDSMLNRINEDTDLAGFLEEFVFDLIEKDKGWNIEPDIKYFGRELFRDRYYTLLESLGKDDVIDKKTIRNVKDKLNNTASLFENRMLDLSNRAKEVLEGYQLSVDDFSSKSKGPAGYLVYKLGARKDYDPKKLARNAAESDEYWYTKNSNKKKTILDCLNDGLRDILIEAVAHFDENYMEYLTAVELRKNIYITGILADLQKSIINYRNENDVFLISDTNRMLKSMIAKDEAPFIYEKTGSHFKHYLIDEFQDTSVFQWMNLAPLIKDALGSGNTALVVGDSKQAIYRWRGGERELLNDIEKEFGEFSGMIERVPLEYNFRSGENIIEFNNLFFKNALTNLGDGIDAKHIEMVETTFNKVEQQKRNDGGYINVKIISEPDKPKWTEEALRDTHNWINAATDDGYALKDIMILTRSNAEAREVTEYLLERNIRVISPDSTNLNSSYAVKFLVNIIKYLHNWKDAIAKTQILYYYLKHVKHESISQNEIFLNRDELFKEKMPEEFSKRTLSLNKFSLVELIEEAVRIFGLNMRNDAYLLRFQDIVLDYSTKVNNDFAGFIEWWEENKAKKSITISGEEDAVNIYTIHKAKGLEKPVVIIPFANWGFEAYSNTIWVSPEQEPFNEGAPYLIKTSKYLKDTFMNEDFLFETAQSYIDNLNLVYVAFTRAAERLYIIAPSNTRSAFSAKKLIQSTISTTNELVQNYNPDTEIFTYGEIKPPRKKSDKTGKAAFEIDTYPATDWHDRLILSSAKSKKEKK
jgi:ATP-dependent helicase/nuclease subunit A